MLKPAGHVNAATAERHLARWLRDVGRRRPPTVTVDLANVTLLDSNGLQALVMLYDHVRDYGGVLRVRGASASQQEVFELTGWDRPFACRRSARPRIFKPQNGGGI
jgi:anti-anti-sigma factor